ncbi:MAG: RES family NAD+ phosphorylase [Acidimicrobiales bacterium]|nr:RES family NAD+ phosphorylase [Acidimicrobiales bacterium]
MPSFDPRALGQLPGAALSAVAYRNQAKGFDPRSGDGARRLGGRFNPPHSFPVLYLCFTRPCVVAELTRQAERQGLNVDALLPRELFEISADLDKVLDLADAATLDSLGIDPADLIREDHRFTQEIGEAAHEHAFQAIRSPSATGVDNVLAIFPEKLAGAVLNTALLGEWSTVDDLAALGP